MIKTILAFVPSPRFRADSDLIKGASTLIVTNIIARALGFLFPVLLTWVFAPVDYGYVRYVLSISTILGGVLTAGLPNALAQRIAAREDVHVRRAYILNVSKAILLLLLGVLVPVTYIFDIISGDLRVISLIVVGGLIIDAMFFNILRGLVLYKTISFYRIAANSLQIIIILSAHLAGILSPLLALFIYSYVYLAPITVILMYHKLKGTINLPMLLPRSNVSISVVRDIITVSIPITVAAMAYTIIMSADSIFVGRFLGLDSVAVYSAIKTATNVFTFVPFGIATVLMPKVASARSRANVNRYVLVSLVACVLCSLALLIVVRIFGDLAMRAIFPPAYQNHAETLFILSLGMVFFSVYTVLHDAWIGRGTMVVPAATLSIGAISNCILNFFLVPTFGIQGAAWGFVGSYAIVLVLLGGLTVRMIQRLGSQPTTDNSFDSGA